LNIVTQCYLLDGFTSMSVQVRSRTDRTDRCHALTGRQRLMWQAPLLTTCISPTTSVNFRFYFHRNRVHMKLMASYRHHVSV